MDAGPDPATARAAERAARVSYGRLVAWLARSWRDVAAAEDALADAFARALASWPTAGVPDNPEAWLLTVARRRLADGARAAKVRTLAAPDLAADTTAEVEPMPAEIPDRRLALMFVCAHPAIDPATRAPLMLQSVLGLDAGRIASAWLVRPATMGQRLVRAKARIREAGIRFEVPAPDEVQPRSEAVREAVYAAYGAGWDAITAADAAVRGLAEEAVWLARVLLDVSPDDPENAGLLALMLFCEARGRARRTADGTFVPLRRQDPSLYDRAMIGEAERLLGAAARARQPGRFQLEAAIQSAHVEQVIRGADLSRPLLSLHAALAATAPTIGNVLGHAVALSEVEGPAPALAMLDALPEERVRDHQPYWATRGHLLAISGRPEEARQARIRAAGLTEDPAVRAHLLAAGST